MASAISARSYYLNEAVRTGQENKVGELLKKDYRPDGQTLTWAYLSRTIKVIDLVFEYGARADEETLPAACASNNPILVIKALHQRALPNKKALEVARKVNNRAISEILKRELRQRLMVALSSKDLSSVKDALNRGAVVVGSFLDLAILSREERIVQALAKAGATPTERSLTLGSKCGSEAIAKVVRGLVLAKEGFEIGSEGVPTHRALIAAIESDNEKAFILLLQQGAKCNDAVLSAAIKNALDPRLRRKEDGLIELHLNFVYRVLCEGVRPKKMDFTGYPVYRAYRSVSNLPISLEHLLKAASEWPEKYFRFFAAVIADCDTDSLEGRLEPMEHHLKLAPPPPEALTLIRDFCRAETFLSKFHLLMDYGLKVDPGEMSRTQLDVSSTREEGGFSDDDYTAFVNRLVEKGYTIHDFSKPKPREFNPEGQTLPSLKKGLKVYLARQYLDFIKHCFEKKLVDPTDEKAIPTFAELKKAKYVWLDENLIRYLEILLSSGVVPKEEQLIFFVQRSLFH